MKNHITALLFSIAIIISAVFLGNAYVKRSEIGGNIEVTGLGEVDFTSDLIVWEGRFSTSSFELKTAFERLNADKEIIKSYLINKGLKAEQLVFSAVSTQQNNKQKYSAKGEYMGEEFTGYTLRQNVTIESTEVEKIELISREVTELLNQGVQFYSQEPRYYYTKLANLKIEMISKATEDARLRAEKIAEFSGGKLGELKSADMGVFQILGQNSDENYSWGGTFNTSSKNKTASITMKLVYKAD